MLAMLAMLGAIMACGRRAAPAGERSARQPPRYDCHDDPALGFPVYIPPVDTAGLGKALAAQFAGYRLSTELEIGCRFPLPYGSLPMQYWPQWGSGNPWWIWRADFDGDGKPDRLMLLSLASDPNQDLLVVLHGNGTAARVAAPGGWGVAVLDPAEARRRGVPGRRRSAIAIVHWGEGSTVYYWNGSAYVALK